MPVTSTTTSADAGKFIQDKLIALSEQIHKLPQFGEQVSLESGMGKTANFMKYNRTDVPVDKLQEGVTPDETTFSITSQTITVDQWGLFISLTDVGVVTTKHPVLNQALNMVSDAIARCQDYNIAEVLNASTNKQFWDGSRADRAAITSSDTFNSSVATRARVDLNDDGAPPRNGDLFVAVIPPQIEGDVLNEAARTGSNLNTQFTTYAGAKASSGDISGLIKGRLGDWMGFSWVRSNYLPKFVRIATFGPPTATTGGSLSGTVYHKVTRKSLTRGFEEAIQVEASTAMGANTRLQFTAPSTAGYVYNIYAGAATGDANLYLVKENLAASGVYNLDALVASGTNPPTTPASGVTVHPMYIFGKEAFDTVTLNGMAMAAGITPKGISDSDPLAQRRKVSAKYMNKSGIRDQERCKVVELASNF